ncbi:MAG: glycosyltransferase [candidate division WOR-3 bacterium]|nr:glycosyltransferase [Thermoproteota archaeon]
MPKVSVISIAKHEAEFERLKKALEMQTFKDFEFITSTKGSIPEAWNDALSRAKGEIIVFIESDAFPLNERWLEEIVANFRKGAVLKGLEINPTSLNLCNLVCDAEIFKKVRFDESFKYTEDTELFARLRKMGVEVGFVNAFPVVHVPSRTWRKTLSRSFRSGMYFMKIIYMHGKENIDNINTQNFKSNYIHPISNRLRIIVENILVLLGLLIGAVIYLPILIKRRSKKDT